MVLKDVHLNGLCFFSLHNSGIDGCRLNCFREMFAGLPYDGTPAMEEVCCVGKYCFMLHLFCFLLKVKACFMNTD